MNLTPAAVAAIAAIALLGIVGQWSETLGALPWWRFAAGLLVLALLCEAWVARRSAVAARWTGGERLFLGRNETLRLEFDNASARRLTVRYAPVLPEALKGEEESASIRLEANGCGAAAVGVRPIRLGEHGWPTLPIRIKGLLGLAWWSRRLETNQRLHVRPDEFGPQASPSGAASTGAGGRAFLGGGLELHHLRPYRPGDPRHTIDWKASARTARLITRVFTDDQHLEVVVALDTGRTSRVEVDGMSQLGHYVNLAARFAEYCVSGDDQVGLVAFADTPTVRLAPARGLAAVMRIRRTVADLRSRAVESDPLAAAVAIRRLVRRRCLVVMLTDLYERGSAGRLVESVRLLAPYHLPIVVGIVGDDVAGLAEAEAREWLDPFRSLAAADHQHQVDGNVARLARLGAVALTAHASELERKVFDRYRVLRAQHRI